MRTIVDIPEEQLKPLAELCKQEGISRAEAIRRALAKMLEQRRLERRKISIDDAFGIWKDRDDIGDAVEYQRKLRAEWDDRDRTVDEWAEYLDKKKTDR